MGADCLLTGEANHHAAMMPCVWAVAGGGGHHATEFPGVKYLPLTHDRPRTAFPELEVG